MIQPGTQPSDNNTSRGTLSALDSTIVTGCRCGERRRQSVTVNGTIYSVETETVTLNDFTISYSGTLPSTGYAVSRDIVLQSMS